MDLYKISNSGPKQAPRNKSVDYTTSAPKKVQDFQIRIFMQDGQVNYWCWRVK